MSEPLPPGARPTALEAHRLDDAGLHRAWRASVDVRRLTKRGSVGGIAGFILGIVLVASLDLGGAGVIGLLLASAALVVFLLVVGSRSDPPEAWVPELLRRAGWAPYREWGREVREAPLDGLLARVALTGRDEEDPVGRRIVVEVPADPAADGRLRRTERVILGSRADDPGRDPRHTVTVAEAPVPAARFARLRAALATLDEGPLDRGDAGEVVGGSPFVVAVARPGHAPVWLFADLQRGVRDGRVMMLVGAMQEIAGEEPVSPSGA
jgi:hypothetical protein